MLEAGFGSTKKHNLTKENIKLKKSTYLSKFYNTCVLTFEAFLYMKRKTEMCYIHFHVSLHTTISLTSP